MEPLNEYFHVTISAFVGETFRPRPSAYPSTTRGPARVEERGQAEILPSTAYKLWRSSLFCVCFDARPLPTKGDVAAHSLNHGQCRYGPLRKSRSGRFLASALFCPANNFPFYDDYVAKFTVQGIRRTATASRKAGPAGVY